MRFWTIARVFLVGVVLASCATTDQVHEKIEETRTGPKHPPVRNITNFSSALQCMDQMMIDYGAPDVVVLMEDLTDTTGKVKAGTRDMLIAALLDMTKRSRAIRINAYGADSGNLISFYEAAGRQSIYHSVPPYDIRGSISQMDKDVVQRQTDAGVAMEQFGIGVAQSAGGSVLGLDLSMISTGDLSVIPGVSSRTVCPSLLM